MALRLLAAFSLAFGIYVLLDFLAALEPGGNFRNWLHFGCVLLPPCGFLGVVFFTRFTGTCSYVGKHGLSRVSSGGKFRQPPKTEVLAFADAVELYACQHRHFVNGIYSSTAYDYSWNDAKGNRLFRLHGSYQGNDRPPKYGDPFHFAVAAEMSWTQHLLERTQHHLETEGSIPFRVDSNRCLRIGKQFLEFHFGGEPVRVTREEVASLKLNKGVFVLTHKDAMQPSHAGQYSFSHASMANAEVFFRTLDRLMGYRWC